MKTMHVNKVLACLATAGAALAAHAAVTDLATVPISGTTMGTAKPNIMLLMDTSKSMDFSHAPDSAEVTTSTVLQPVNLAMQPVGYRSYQCNSLYYNPNTVYKLPLNDLGLPLPEPDFTAARYNYYSSDLTTVDLSANFRAFDPSTRSNTDPDYRDDPLAPTKQGQAAYYYIYKTPANVVPDAIMDSGNPTTTPASKGKCNVAFDTSFADMGGSISGAGPIPGGGTWTHILVGSAADVTSAGATPADKQRNFARWYVYYRTRIAASKSGISLAFFDTGSPLSPGSATSDRYRVGLITANPLTRATPASKPSVGSLVDAQYYQKLADFDAPQKAAWYSKLTSQVPGGSSPMREGLARVGRHYAGKTDGINAGMTLPDSTGTENCQQNFAIMTTDGYWNTQAETVGPVKLDGTTLVGQMDGFLTEPDPNPLGTLAGANYNTPRTIWDGGTDGVRKTYYATNTYSLANCPSGNVYKTDSQRRKKTSRWLATGRQDTLTTRQLWKQEWQQTFTLVQKQAKTIANVENATQVTSFTTPYTVTQTITSTTRAYEGYTKSSAQLVLKKVYTVGLSQTYAWTDTTYSKIGTWVRMNQTAIQQYYNETWNNVASCTDANPLNCRTVTRTGYPMDVANGSCTAGAGAAPDYWVTTCTAQDTGTTYVKPTTYDGSGNPINPCPSANWTTGVVSYTCGPSTSTGTSSCDVSGSTAVTAPDGSFTKTKTVTNSASPFKTRRCVYSESAPGTHVDPGTCGSYTSCTTTTTNTSADPTTNCSDPNFTASNGNGWTTTTCTYPAATNFSNQPVTVGSCTPGTEAASSTNDWTATSCVKTTQAATPARCVPIAQDAAYTSNPNLTDASAWSGGLTYDGSGNVTKTDPATLIKYTCHQTVTTNAGLSPGAAACNPTNANVYPGASSVPATSSNSFTQTSCSGLQAGTASAAALTGTCTAVTTPTAATSWKTTTCNTPTVVTGWPKFVASCPASYPAPSAPDYITYSCTANVTTAGWKAVEACTPGLGGSYTNPASGAASGTPTTSTGVLNPVDPLVTVQCRNNPTYEVAGSPGVPTTYYRTAGASQCPLLTGNAVTMDTSRRWVTCADAVMVFDGPTDPTDAACSGSYAPANNNPGTSANQVTYSLSGKNAIRQCTWVGTTPRAATSPASGAANTHPWPINASVPAAAVQTGVNPDGTALCTAAAQSPAAGNDFVAKTCTSTYPLAANTPQPDNSLCGGGSNTSQFNASTKVYYTCSQELHNDPISWSASCTSQAADSSNSWTNITCPGPVGSPGPLDDPSLLEVTGPALVPAASCVSNPGTTAPNYVKTECESVDGKKVRYSTSTYNSTQSTSNGVPVGAITNTSPVVTALADVPGLSCYVTGDPLAAELDAAFSSGSVSAAPSASPWWQTANPTPPTGCTGWPCEVNTIGGTAGSSNSLADVAQYYYVTDLRAETNNVPRGADLASATWVEDDRARWQHMTTYVLGLGVSGLVPYSNTYKSDPMPATSTALAFPRLRAPAPPMRMDWPVWPTGAETADWQFSDPRSIDDFWHAAVNGRGRYFSAQNPTQLVTGIQGMLNSIGSSMGAGAGAASTVPVISGTGGDLFTTNYVAGAWSGDVQAKTFTFGSGVSATATWSAQSALAAKIQANCDDRNIYLMRDNAVLGSSLTAFTWNTTKCTGGGVGDGLNNVEKDWFGRTTSVTSTLTQFDIGLVGNDSSAGQRSVADGAHLVNFLRGQTGKEDYVGGDVNKLYRSRHGAYLGDIANSQAAYVGAPSAGYVDGGYASFKSSNSGRTPMVYVGANDGMLHAFNSSTGANAGREEWAVIPSTVAPNMPILADINYSSKHRFFVDGSPVVGDVYDSVNARWRTILVGGLNNGGQAYYALDVTDPASPEALWEFKSSTTCVASNAAAVGERSDCNLGYTYGKPVITKLADGTWVVLVTSGYNNHTNGNGKGYLYAINAMTGAIVKRFSTSAGSTTDPSGLREISTYVSNPNADNTTLRAYGGDLHGNVWRFDVNDSTRDEAVLVTSLRDGAPTPNRQPITTRVFMVEVDGQTFLYVGTGKLLGNTDLSDTSTQSVYVFKDPLIVPTGGAPELDPTTLRSSLKTITMATTAYVPDPATGTPTSKPSTRTATCVAATGNCSSTLGWYMDFNVAGERMTVDMAVAKGTLVYATSVPVSAEQCANGYDLLNYTDYMTGQTNDLTAFMSDSTATGMMIGCSSGGGSCLKAIVTHSNGTVTEHNLPSGTAAPLGKRISWREITTQ